MRERRERFAVHHGSALRAGDFILDCGMICRVVRVITRNLILITDDMGFRAYRRTQA